MSTPVHQTSHGRSRAVLTPNRQRRDVAADSAQRGLLAVQSAAGNRAATAMVQRARGAVKETPTEKLQDKGAAPAGSGSPDYRERIAVVLDKLKKNLEFVDTFVKGFQVPTNAGFAEQASATADDGLKSDTGDSGASANTETFAADAVGAALAGMEASKAKNDAAKHKEGAAFHGASKKYNAKTADAVVGATSAAGNALGVAKELTKAEHALHAASAAEVSGIGSGVASAAKAGRAARRTVITARKYRRLKAIERSDRVGAEELARLDQARSEASWEAARAYAALDALWTQEGGLEGVPEALDKAEAAVDKAHAAAKDLQAALNQNTMDTVLGYALSKQRHKMGKQGFTALAESTKVAGGVVTAVAATAAGAGLASTPVGWGLAAAAAGLTLGVTAYKAGRAAKKRYDGARHPDRWAAEGQAVPEAASRKDALKEALRFWKKVENGERQAMARKIYALAAGPDIKGSALTTEEMRASARDLLVALKAGPAHQRLTPEAWSESLNSPEKTAAWIKEIAEQLSSA